MATFNVCDTVTVPPGGSFTWHNPFTQPVTIAPEGTWFRPGPPRCPYRFPRR